jgi:hypothetical protein
MDQKDLFAFFLNLRQDNSEEEIYTILEKYEINKLDISRIYRYLDKYSQEEDELPNGQDDDTSVFSNI